MANSRSITDRTALEAHRARARTRPEWFLHEEAAADMDERLSEVKKAFTAPALVGPGSAPFARLFPAATRTADEDRLALTPAAHDLVIHAFGLHWADDPVGQMVQSRLALRPDGLFLGVLFAGQTLNELRTCLAEAETRLTGGLSPRVAPMADLRDLGGLLQRAGLALPVADSRVLTVRYTGLGDLVRDLRGMGETNALASRSRRCPPRGLFTLAEEIYRSHFSDGDGYLKATFELVYLTGWAPADSQPKPLRPGSASARLADALGTEERPAGDSAAPRLR